MKQRTVLILLLAVFLFSKGFAQQELKSHRSARKGEAAGYSARDATCLSMMGWGLGLGVGIALLCGLLHSDTESTSHSH